MPVELKDADDDLDDKEEKDLPKPVDPKEQARMIAREMFGLQQQANQQQGRQTRESKVQSKIEKMIADGMPPDAIRTVLDLVGAFVEDKEAADAEKGAVYQAQQFNAALFARAEEALEAFRGKVPQFETMQPGLVKQISNLISRHEEFSGARTDIEGFKLPSMSHFTKAADMAVDAVLTEFGVTKKQAPVTIANSKAKPQQQSFEISGLDSDERKMYFAIKNTLGEKRAQEAVKDLRSNRGR